MTSWNFTSLLLSDDRLQQLFDLPGSGLAISFVYWLRQSALVFLLLPMLIIVFIYLTVVMVHLCRLRYWLLRHFISLHLTAVSRLTGRTATSSGNPSSATQQLQTVAVELAGLLKRLVAAVWDAHGRIFHAYEIVGMEKLPPKGPAYVVYYHGTCPFDVYYFLSRYCIERDKFPICVVDRLLFRLPALRYLLDLLGAIEGSVQECVEKLNSIDPVTGGNVLLIAPGGMREAIFSDEFYSIIWGKRCGFARVAIQSGQPIYPMFTENIRESIRVVQLGKRWWQWLYEKTRLPIVLYYGYFPVKLRTYIGDPIYPREGESTEELAERVKHAVSGMIRRRQWTPSNLFCALLQRIPAFDRWFKRRKEARRRTD